MREREGGERGRERTSEREEGGDREETDKCIELESGR